MSEDNPFKSLKDERIELGEKLKIAGKSISIIPEVEDAELFMTLRGEDAEQEGKRMTKIMLNMLKRSYPTAEESELRKFIAMHYADLLEEVAVIYGFTTRVKLEKAKKKAISEEAK